MKKSSGLPYEVREAPSRLSFEENEPAKIEAAPNAAIVSGESQIK